MEPAQDTQPYPQDTSNNSDISAAIRQKADEDLDSEESGSEEGRTFKPLIYFIKHTL